MNDKKINLYFSLINNKKMANNYKTREYNFFNY